MAFGKNKDEIFQRVATVTDEPEAPAKKKKKGRKAEEEVAAPAPDTTMWKSSDDAPKAQHFDTPAAPKKSAKAASVQTNATQSDASVSEAKVDEKSGVREVGSAPKDARPVLDYGALREDPSVTGGLYSDSGRTATMAMRLVSYIMYILGPMYFIGKIFKLIGTDADSLTTGMAVSTVIDGVIGCALLICGGILIVALIKILQNLMALKKKK